MNHRNHFLYATSRLLLIVFCAGSTVLPLWGGQEQKREEKVDPFWKWLSEDVVYVITSEEKTVFEKLTTSEEKENFVEQFWRRRDPDPSTEFNEFKVEHYRRLAYANEQFGNAGIPGWKTDRGRIYITFGPATSVERYGGGAIYDRDISEGGGTTQVYPMEKWYYNHIQGIGNGIEIEFVDRSMTGDYRLALRPEEKDALLFMDGAGLTLFEQMGLETRAGRIRTMDVMRSVGGEDDAVHKHADNPFLRLEKYFKLQQPAPIQFADLKAAVAANIAYNELPFLAANGYWRLNEQSLIVPVTVFLSLKDLTYETLAGGVSRAKVNLYGSIRSLGGRIVAEFEETIYDDRPQPSVRPFEYKLHQRTVSLPPGIYKLDLIAKDVNANKIGHLQQKLDVPRLIPEQLSLSWRVLSDLIVPSKGETLSDPFVTALGWKVFPAPKNRFRTGGRLGLYFEIYGFTVDQAKDIADLDISATILNFEGRPVIERPKQHLLERFADRIAVAFVFSLEGVTAGNYTLELRIQDNIQQKEITAKEKFEVTATDP